MKTRFFSAVLIVTTLLVVCLSTSGLAKEATREIKRVSGSSSIAANTDIFGYPDYDSGWKDINKDAVLTLIHDLGGNTDNYIVDLQFKDEIFKIYGVNQYGYGGEVWLDYASKGALRESGAYWYGLTNTEIKVKRLMYDVSAAQVRVRIWVLPSSSFDSGWDQIPADSSIHNINHNVGGNTDDYIVDMQFSDKNLLNIFGLNQYGYGMIYSYIDENNLGGQGALWSHLDDKDIFVARGTFDEAADNLRVRIWENNNPDYDSGWIELETSKTETLSHNLGGNADDFVVDLQFKEEGGKRVNQQYYGGNTYNIPPDGKVSSVQGAHWFNLTNNEISLFRRANDTSAPKARVRIWIAIDTTFLPLVIR